MKKTILTLIFVVLTIMCIQAQSQADTPGVKGTIEEGAGSGNYDLAKDIERNYLNNGDYLIKSKNGEELNVEQYSIEGKLISKYKGLIITLPNGNNDLNLLRISNSKGSLNAKIIL